MHMARAALEAGLAEVRRAPSEAGTVELIVARPAVGERTVLAEGRIDTEAGLSGDTWLARKPHLGKQVTVMNARAVALVAGPRDRWPLAGDQLFVDLDLSTSNLPPGTRLELGSVVLEVSAYPHRGCKKFLARFGPDALDWVNSEVGCALNLRGINTTVVHSGVVRTGDTIRRAVRPVAAAGEPGSAHAGQPGSLTPG
jgi:MOSC domain-containing protein YiiM